VFVCCLRFLQKTLRCMGLTFTASSSDTNTNRPAVACPFPSGEKPELRTHGNLHQRIRSTETQKQHKRSCFVYCSLVFCGIIISLDLTTKDLRAVSR